MQWSFMLAALALQSGEVCNETSYMVEAAKAWRTENGIAAEGWTRIAPGACAQMPPDAGVSEQYLYARSTRAYPGGVREWRGTLGVCVDEEDFSFEGAADCASLGLQVRQFRALNETERTRAVLVELDDFGSRAEEAGLQRLLQAAGYAIRVIDGYAGLRTRRAVSAFESDIGRSFGSDRAAMIEALHARALEAVAHAGVRICNDASAPVTAAIARAAGEGEFETRGWWRVEPGACARALGDRLADNQTYYHARLMEEGGMKLMTGGEEAFCVSPGRFTSHDRGDCEANGFERAMFRPAPEPENGGAMVRLTRADFEED